VPASDRHFLPRWIAAFVIALACAWQVLAFAGAGAGSLRTASEPGHHHHGDGALHFEDSADSRTHGFGEHAELPPAVLPEAADIGGFGAMALVAMAGASTLPEPPPDGLFRPPRHAAA
jgi:hypothetical protein